MRPARLSAVYGVVALGASLAGSHAALAQIETLHEAITQEDERQGEAAGQVRRERTRRVEVAPYIEVSQNAILTRDGSNDELLTYTAVAAGVTSRIETRAVSLTADLRYQHQYSWTKASPDQDIFTGLANGRVNLVRDALVMEGGFLGTRLRVGNYQGANSSLADTRFTSDVFSTYIGPNLKTHVGDLSVIGAYRFGYNKVDSKAPGFAFDNAAPGTFDQSTLHNAALTVGMRPDMMAPFGWTVGAGYTRESSNQLDQRFSDSFGKLDVTLPLSSTVALVAGLGYQYVRASNRDVLRDAGGNPLRDDRGRLRTDPASPRHLAYESDGVFWDAGVLWRPSDRTTLEARAGHRYGTMSYTGSFSWKPGARTSMSIRLFDSVDSFGRALNGALANLPDDFTVSRNPFSGDMAGCAFSLQSGGSCFVDTLTGIGAANYRNRGVYVQLAHTTGLWTFNAAGGYSRRKFLASGGTVLSALDGLTDQMAYATLNLARSIDTVSTVDANIYVNHLNPGFASRGSTTNLGAYAGYHRRIGRRFIANASVGVDSTREEGLDNVLVVLAQLGLRYQF